MNLLSSKAVKIALALLVSAVFVFFAFRGVDFMKIYKLITGADIGYIFVMFLTVIVAQTLRSLRWGVMLHPVEPLKQKLLFPISSIGFMLIVVLPARLGELVRPYLLNQNSRISVSTAMATVVLERILDSLFILAFFAITVGSLRLPEWVIRGVYSITIALIALIGLLVFGSFRSVNSRLTRLIHTVAPKRFAAFVDTALERFYEGMSVLGKTGHSLVIVLLTASIWGIFVLSNVLLFKAFRIPLGPFAAMSVLALTALGISVPAGPAFIGNFHFFCALALSFFGISKEAALGYAMVNHAVVVGTIVLLGVLCSIPRLNPGINLLRRLRPLRSGLDK